MCKERSFVKRSFYRDHYKDMWSSDEAYKNIVKGEWEKFKGRTWENAVQQFEKLAKSSLAKLKTCSKAKFEDKERKQTKLIEQLKYVK